MKALIFANGEPNDGAMVRRSLSVAQNAHVIAADGGARVAQYFGFDVQTVIGDMDSLSEDEVARLEKMGASVLRYPPEKNETDLELALLWAAQHDMDWIRIVGGMGGRFDQQLANAYLLALPQLIGRDVRMVAGKQAIRLVQPGQTTILGQPGDTISLIPVGGPVEGIRTEFLTYPLQDETLYFGPARGVSNVMDGEKAIIHVQAGMLLLVHTIGRA